MKRDNKVRLLRITASLLQRQGLHATSLNQIVAESRAPKGSLYFHFPGGKEELACMALAQASHELRQRLEPLIQAASTPAQVIDAVCQALGNALAESNYIEGSPLATVALEASSHSPQVRETCVRHYAAWEELIHRRLQDIGLPVERSADLSVTIVSAVEGALILCRIRRNTEPLQRVAAFLCDSLEPAFTTSADSPET